VEHEITTAAFIVHDIAMRKDISEDAWSRLAQAAARIGRARHG
jgi:hypothetical protein